MKYRWLTLILVLLLQRCFAQPDVSSSWKADLYAEGYYRFPFRSPEPGNRIPILYNFSRQQQPDINLLLGRLRYQHGRFTARGGLMAGSYSKYNLEAEPGFLKNIFEANLGYRFSNRWSAEAGILPSHIGLESAIGKDNWNASRSLLAENSPYYETGLRIQYEPNERFSASVLLLNGWQHIRDNNSDLAFGSQLQFKPDSTWLINSSFFAGNEMADSTTPAMRWFHNFFITRSFSHCWSLAVLLDIGAQQHRLRTGYNWWCGTGMMVQYRHDEKLRAALRIEQLKDRSQTLIHTGTANGFNVRSVTFNTDYYAGKHWMIRAEWRLFRSGDVIFSNSRRRNAGLLVTLAGWL